MTRAQQLARGMSQSESITHGISLHVRHFSLRAQQIALSVTIPSPAAILILIQNEQHKLAVISAVGAVGRANGG